MAEKHNVKIITEDGSEYYGYSFGAEKDTVCEIVFNTSPVGYQEIISDPSYTYQAVVMTYPLIGNYGICEDDFETDFPSAGALIVREYCDKPSNFRCAATLGETMKKFGIPGVYGVDTRKLTRSIRDLGSRKALITSSKTSMEEGLLTLKNTPLMKNAVSTVSSKEMRFFPAENEKYKVLVIDCGVKLNIIRRLNEAGCGVTLVPFDTPPDVIHSLAPDGILISNGPGDPEDLPVTIKNVRELIGKYPILGICLGHQILSLACGAETYKLKFGHRGGNHPVLDIETNKIEITSQNHSYAVRESSLEKTGLLATHINLLDKTVEGVRSAEKKLIGIQYHPESAPGPHDSGYIFERFIDLMEDNNGKENRYQ